MRNGDTETYAVSLEVEATQQEIAAAQAAFDQIGMPVRVAADYYRKSAGDLAWLIAIAAPVGALLTYFKKPIETFFDPVAQSLGERFRDWVDSLFAARAGSNGSVALTESPLDAEARHPEILFDRGLPAEAYGQLADLIERDAFDEIPGECWQIRYVDGA